MMKHRGEILKRYVDQSGLTKKDVATALHISLSKLYRLFDDPSVPFDVLLKAGKILRHDFSEEFPHELANPNRIKSIEENLDYKLKFYDLLERYSEVQEQLVKYLKVKKAS